MLKGLKRIIGSSKCWLALAGCITAGATGQWHMIPKIVMVTIGAIAAEDAARKIGVKTPTEEMPRPASGAYRG